MTGPRIHVGATYYGGIPEYGYLTFASLPAAMAWWEDVAYEWDAAFASHNGDPFDPDACDYVTDGRDYEARLQIDGDPTRHDLMAIAIRRNLIGRDQNRTVIVEVDEWSGCDEPWSDPVYVTARDETGFEYVDAVADLDAAPFDEQVNFIAEQLKNG
jgi:hypothetical protein